MEQRSNNKERPVLSDQLRVIFKKPIERFGILLNNLGIKPNIITFLGVSGTFVGAAFIALGNFLVGAILIMFFGAIDVLDGAVARARGEPEKFGAFVDSVSDRYGELAIFGALMWYFVGIEEYRGAVITFLGASGSVMVSYVRARAQSLGFDTKVGILSRFERMLVLAPSILFNIPLIGVSIVAVLSHVTALQRIIHVRRQALDRK